MEEAKIIVEELNQKVDLIGETLREAVDRDKQMSAANRQLRQELELERAAHLETKQRLNELLAAYEELRSGLKDL